MINERTVARDGDGSPARLTWLTVQMAFDADRDSEHYRIGSGAGEEREIPDGPRSGALAWRGSVGMLADPVQLQKTTRCGLGIRASEPSFCFFARGRVEW